MFRKCMRCPKLMWLRPAGQVQAPDKVVLIHRNNPAEMQHKHLEHKNKKEIKRTPNGEDILPWPTSPSLRRRVGKSRSFRDC